MKVLAKAHEIRLLGARKNLSIREIAKGTGVTTQQFGKVLTRTSELRPRARRALMTLLHAKFDDLFEVIAGSELERRHAAS